MFGARMPRPRAGGMCGLVVCMGTSPLPSTPLPEMLIDTLSRAVANLEVHI